MCNTQMVYHDDVTFIIGMIQLTYIPLQFNIWWVTYILVLLWTVRNPFKVKRLSTEVLFKKIHISITIIGILLPIAPVIALVVYDVINPHVYGTLGFGFAQTPPWFCVGLSSTSYFYFITLPNVILSLIGITGLAITIWTIHKVKIEALDLCYILFNMNKISVTKNNHNKFI